jgi:ribosomal protein S18 acetylase RimI-like enzyme
MHENLMLKVEPVGRDNLAQFIRYAAAHGSEHDESYLPDEGFAPSQEHPAYMLMQSGEEASYHTYSLLFNAVQRHFAGLDGVYLFLPENRRAAAEALGQLGFAIERYSYVMKIDNVSPAGLVVPEGLTLLPIQASDEHFARLFADAINANFSELAGHVPMTVDLVLEWIEEGTYLEDGIALLLEGRRAVGTVGVMCDSEDHNAGEIMALSVAKEYRGRGLGQLLLRHAVCFATWRGLRPVFLSVNAENRAALRLYQAAGFSVTDMMVCYSRDCGAANLPSGSPARQD